MIVVDVEPDPDKPGKQRFKFSAVKRFVPPSSVELATTATKPIVEEGAGDQLPPPVAEERWIRALRVTA